MSDYSELKLLSQCVGALLMLQERQAYILDHEERCAMMQFMRQANPVTVLRLIEEIERLKAENDELCSNLGAETCKANSMERLAVKRGQERDALRKDAERYRYIKDHDWHIAEDFELANKNDGDLDLVVDAAMAKELTP